MRTTSAPRGRLVLAGLGPRPPATCSIEALHALGRCAVIFFMAGDKAALREFCPRVPVQPFSIGKAKRELRRGRRVGVASIGHPLVFSAAAAPLLRLGCEVETYGAVSALDEALAALGLSLGRHARGIQIVPSSELSRSRWLASQPLVCPVEDPGELRILAKKYPAQRRCKVILGKAADDAVVGGLFAPAGAIVFVEGER